MRALAPATLFCFLAVLALYAQTGSTERAHLERGIALLDHGNPSGATVEFRLALQTAPKDPIAHYDLALALARMNDWDAAIAEYRESLRFDPNRDETHNNLAIALAKKGDLDAAIASFAKRCG